LPRIRARKVLQIKDASILNKISLFPLCQQFRMNHGSIGEEEEKSLRKPRKLYFFSKKITIANLTPRKKGLVKR